MEFSSKLRRSIEFAKNHVIQSPRQLDAICMYYPAFNSSHVLPCNRVVITNTHTHKCCASVDGRDGGKCEKQTNKQTDTSTRRVLNYAYVHGNHVRSERSANRICASYAPCVYVILRRTCVHFGVPQTVGMCVNLRSESARLRADCY